MEQRFYTIKELASLLRVSELWIRRRMKSGEISSYKIGKRRLFKKEEIDLWIESQRENMTK